MTQTSGSMMTGSQTAEPVTRLQKEKNMDKTNYRTDCFAHKGNKCSALKVMNCHNCNFYKKAKGKADSGEKEKR